MIYGRRYWQEYAVWFLLFMAAMFLVKKATLWLPEGSPFRGALVVLPVIAVVGAFWVELRALRRADELQQRIYLEALFLGSFALVGFCVAAFMAELVFGMPRVSPMWMICANAAGSGVGLVIARRRYR